MKQFLGIVFVGLSLAACSPEFRAQQAERYAKDMFPTAYGEKSFFSSNGYSDRDIDDNSVDISYRVNAATSRERHLNLMLYHAALLAQERGKEEFLLTDVKRWVVCKVGDYGAFMRATAKFDGRLPGSGNWLQVSEVTAAFGAEASTPTEDFEMRQRILLSYIESCASRRIVEQEDVVISSEEPGTQR